MPVEVAHFRREAALAEVILVWRRRLVIGEVENADIDGGDNNARCLAGFQPADLDRDRERTVRLDLRRQFHVERQGARGAIDREPLHADGAAGHALRRRVERTAQSGDQISAGAPILADGNRDLSGAGCDILRLASNQPVGEHVEREFPGGCCRHRDIHRVAAGVTRFVERDFEKVRRLGAGLGVEPRVEAQRRHRAIASLRHFETIAAPLHRQRQPRRLGGGGVERAVGDALGALDRLELPIAVLPIPLIAGLNLEQFVFQTLALKRRAVGCGDHHIEIGIGAIGQRTAGKRRFDADHMPIGHDRQRQLALNRAAAGFRHADGDRRLQRTRCFRHVVKRDRERCLAAGVGLRQVGQFLTHRRHLVVGKTKTVSGKARPFLGSRDADRATQFQTGTGRAVEKAAIDAELRGAFARQRFRSRGQFKLDAVGHVVLDHEGRLTDRRALRIGISAHAPCAGRSGRDNRHGQRAAAEPLIGHDDAAIVDAVGTFDHKRHRHICRGDAARVAQQCGDRHALAGAIDAALGINEGIVTDRRRPAGHAAIRQIEARRFQTQKRIVGFAAGNDRGRRLPALTARQADVEMSPAISVTWLDGQHFIVARDQPYLGARQSLRAGERMHEHVDAVLRRIGAQAEIGDDEPLRRKLVVVWGQRFLRRGGHRVNAGFEVGQRLIDRKRSDDFGIELLLDGEFAAPHLAAALRRQLLRLVAAQIALEVVAENGVDQVAVADAIDRQQHRSGIDAQNRNAALAGTRQHIGLAGEARERLAVAHEDGELGGLGQSLAHGRRQSGAQGDGVALAVPEAFNAELLVIGRHRRAILPDDGDIRRKIGALAGQRFRKLETGARRHGVAVHRVIEHAEAMLGAQLLIVAARLGVLAHVERQP